MINDRNAKKKNKDPCVIYEISDRHIIERINHFTRRFLSWKIMRFAPVIILITELLFGIFIVSFIRARREKED